MPPAAASPLGCLRLWTLCGEVAPASLVERHAASLPHVQLVNDYSSWEGCDAAYADLHPAAPDAAAGAIAPVGRPPAGVAIAVLDPDSLAPVPLGCLGEV